MGVILGACRYPGSGAPCEFHGCSITAVGKSLCRRSINCGERGRLMTSCSSGCCYGISCRNYEMAASAVPWAIGFSSSSVSRTFTRASAQQLQALQERYLSPLGIMAVFLDGKTFADMMMVLAVGITLTGEKHLLGFVETGTQNEALLTRFLQSFCDRGLSVSQALMVIIDGGKGLRGAVRQGLGGRLSFNDVNGSNGKTSCRIFQKANKPTGERDCNARFGSPPLTRPVRL